MGDLYWWSLANSPMNYDWCNLLKCNHFWHGVTVLRPECYTLEVKLRTMDTVHNTNTAQLRKPGSCKHFRGHGRGRANYQNNNGMYQYQYYTHDQQSEQYGPPCSLCGRFHHSPKHCYKDEHDINNIMEKISINPHQSQQSNLYQ